MRPYGDIKVMWMKYNLPQLEQLGIKQALVDLPTGVRGHVVVGWNEGGFEHVSIELMAKRLPTWEEMCYIKQLFWDDEEMVVQIHPRKSQYVNLTDALHLWRAIDDDWAKLGKELQEG